MGNVGEDYGRAHARAVVEDALRAVGMTYANFADEAGLSVDTVRDFITGQRWPRARKQWQMEDALGWPRGRIDTIAREYDVVTDERIQSAGMSDRPPGHLPALESAPEPQLTVDLTELTVGNRHKVWALYYDLLEEQRRQDAV